jgi:hypothetical protein
MNDTNTDTHNPIFKTLQETNTREQHTIHSTPEAATQLMS